MVIGVVFTIAVFVSDGSDSSVNLLLCWAYAMLVLGIVAVLFGIGRDASGNPKKLVNIGIVVAAAVVLVGAAYLLAPGTPALGYVGAEISEGTLKLTDTILNLTYFAVVAAIGAIIYGAIVDSAKK